MKIIESQMSLPDRMVAESSVAQLTESEQTKYGTLATTVAGIESMSTLKSYIPGMGEEVTRSEVADENFNPLSYVPKEMFNNGKLDLSLIHI